MGMFRGRLGGAQRVNCSPSLALRKDLLVEWRERYPERTWQNDGGEEGDVVQSGVRLERVTV